MLFLLLGPGLKAFGLQVVTESPTLGPEKIRIVRKEGLQLYKDPNLWDWQELEMDPRLTCLTGEVTIQRLYTQRLRNFRYVSKVYESKLSELLRTELKYDPLQTKLKAEGSFGQEHEKGLLGPMVAVFIEILDGAYRGTFGFVVADDLKKAQTQEQTTNRLPPSVDSIPQWKASTRPPS